MTDVLKRGWVRRRGAPAMLGLLTVATLFALRIADPVPFERMRLATFDELQRVHPWSLASSPVRVVDIDDGSLSRLGQWPWSRSLVAALVRRLQDAGAASIAFDVLFAEPDRTSPARLASDWRARFGWTAPPGTARLPDYDAELAAAFARGRVITGFGLVAQTNKALPPLGATFATIGGDPTRTLEAYHGAIANLPVLDAAAAGKGAFSITGGRDQVIRRLPLLLAMDGALVPSLALEALRVALDEDTVGVRTERDGGQDGPVTGYTVRIGETEMPLASDGTLQLAPGDAVGRPFIPAWRLLDTDDGSRLDADLRGKIVLVGTSAVGLSDLRATPLNPLEPGVNIHARAIEQILGQHFLSRPGWSTGAEVLAAALMGALFVVLATACNFSTIVPAGLLLACLTVCGSWTAFEQNGWLIDPAFIMLALLAGGLPTSFARYLIAERDASQLRSAFTHYLSPDLVAALARDPERLKLGGELRDMTFLFTDLEGFTSLMEAADPEQAVSLLNGYLDGLCRVAIAHGGTVDKIVGDALHVMFNAPLDQPDHPERAVRCALAIDDFAQGFAAEKRAAGLAFGVTRIGVNTGTAVVGNFGGSGRFDYTAHGDAINTAARLESANKALGTRICVARSTADRVPGLGFLPVGTLMLKGKSRGVDVFAPLQMGAAPSPWTADYLDAFERLSQGGDDGGDRLLALHAADPQHPVLALHARRVREGERSVRMVA